MACYYPTIYYRRVFVDALAKALGLAPDVRISDAYPLVNQKLVNQKVAEVPLTTEEANSINDIVAERFAAAGRLFAQELKAVQPMSGIPRIPDTISINGATLCASGLIDILNMVTQPNPRRWYRFERKDDLITVETKESE